MMEGTRRIVRERLRQIDKEGWTPDHDSHYERDELPRAAACYARAQSSSDPIPDDWPWESSWWKPSDDPVRNREKAGALIAAEIDRLLRAREKGDE